MSALCSFCGSLPSIAVSRNHRVGVCKRCAAFGGELDHFVSEAISSRDETPGSGLPVATQQFSGTDQLHRGQRRRRGSSAAELAETARRQAELTRRRSRPKTTELSLAAVLDKNTMTLTRHTRRVTRGQRLDPVIAASIRAELAHAGLSK